MTEVPVNTEVRSPLGSLLPLGHGEYAALLAEVVADSAPRLFAVVQEVGDREDGWVAAWGLAFEDRAEVVPYGGGVRMSLPSAEGALRHFGRGGEVRASLYWVGS
ncbi:hypothetical protein [Streptomyces sp. NPDC088258]|uniref:hypothetical protein n=1 Tax=Streptomyces sp. NPDC088258 TaxID=3365849 RepID=UPI0038180DB1